MHLERHVVSLSLDKNVLFLEADQRHQILFSLRPCSHAGAGEERSENERSRIKTSATKAFAPSPGPATMLGKERGVVSVGVRFQGAVVGSEVDRPCENAEERQRGGAPPCRDVGVKG